MRKFLKIKWSQYSLVLLLAILGMATTSSFAYETAKYKVLSTENEYEVRDYEAMTMVAAPMNKGEKKNQNDSFRKLFRYISKGNEKSEKIAMTTPVFGVTDEDDSKMFFVMPQKVAKNGVPKPNDKDLVIVEKKEGRFATYRYSGRSNAKMKAEAEVKLLQWVKKKGFKMKGKVFWAGYNSPITPGFLRRNEALVEIIKEDAP